MRGGWNICTGPEQVRVRIKAVGICGSDVHYLKVERSTVPLGLQLPSIYSEDSVSKTLTVLGYLVM